MTDTEVGQGNPPPGVKFGDPDHPLTREAISDHAWAVKRREILSQYPSLAAQYLEGDND